MQINMPIVCDGILLIMEVVEVHTGTLLQKIGVAQNGFLTLLGYEMSPKFYSIKSWSHDKIKHIINNINHATNYVLNLTMRSIPIVIKFENNVSYSIKYLFQ